MATLNSLGLNEVFENPAILGEGISIHQWLISRIKVNNLTSSVVTNGLLFDLQSHVHIKRSRHDKHDPKRQLTKVIFALNKSVLELGDQLNGVRTS